MDWRKLTWFALGVIAVALGALTLMVLLPHDKFLRYQSLNDKYAPTSYWIYQRINFDPTPIDVAFIGTSRTGMAIHSARLQQDLARAGAQLNVANLHVVRTGRNMHFAIIKELLEHRSVKLLVLEMDEREDRVPHSDFIFIADAWDVISAPLFINLRYFTDLARLPGRQFGLFVDTQLRNHGLGYTDFVLPAYEGPHLDHAEYVQSLDGVRHSRAIVHSEQEMENLRAQQDAQITPPVLPASLAWLENRFPRYYVDKILALAAAHHAQVVFLYLPRYGAPGSCLPYDQQYAGRVPLINPAPVMQDYRLYEDAVHMNWDGAQRVTDYVATQILERGYATR